jgi:predicted acyl esterase
MAASSEKWLEMHGGEHWTGYYTDAGIALQKRFFDYYLKGERNGWDKVPRVNLKIRHPGEEFVERPEDEWPIARTEYRKLYLDVDGLRLASVPPSTARQASYGGLSDGLTFLSGPLEAATEITGHTMARLFVSSETADADLFLVLRIFAPDFKELVFKGALDPNTPVGQGWLRASHRKLDPNRSTPFKPYHSHDEKQLLRPGEIYPLDIEILPTSVVVPAGYRIGLSIRGRDYVYPGGGGARLSNMKNAFTGCGPFLHDNGRDRPPEIFAGRVTLHTSRDQPSYLQLPIVPPKT